jgi:hypothetical protein
VPRANDAIGLMAALGTKQTAKVVVKEFTTTASVWIAAQFLDGTAMSGKVLGLRIAAGNVPNLVDLSTGGAGAAVLDPLNSVQTPTMAHMATLGEALSGCITRVTTSACADLFAAASAPGSPAPTNTLAALESNARHPAYKPERFFALLNAFYPVPKGKALRSVPFLPYLRVVPSAWTIALKFSGGGVSAPGKLEIDADGNIWGQKPTSSLDRRPRTRSGMAAWSSSPRTVGRSNRRPSDSMAAASWPRLRYRDRC